MYINIKKTMVLIMSIIIVAIGSSLTLKAAVGLGALEALGQSLHDISKIPVGTCGMILNFICIGLQIVILKRSFKYTQLLQIPLNILLGFIVNIFIYDVLSTITINSYILNIIILLIGYLICAFSIGALIALDIVTFSLEATCLAISDLLKKEFYIVRQVVDGILIIICIILSLLYDIPISVREGTIIGMIVLAPITQYAIKMWTVLLKKIDIIECI
ncbi:MAG: hypothetical protein ACK5LC_18010 [Coprobacillaceae bacterium]